MVPGNAVAKEAVEKGNVSAGDRRRQRAQNTANANRGGSAVGRKADAQHKQRKLGKRVVQYGTRRAHHYGNTEEHRELLGSERISAAAHKRANHHQQHRNTKHAQARLIAAERKRQQRNRPNKGNRLANSPNAPDQACGQNRAQKGKSV